MIICDLCNQARPVICALVQIISGVIWLLLLTQLTVTVIVEVEVVAQLIRPQLARVYWHSWSYWMQ